MYGCLLVDGNGTSASSGGRVLVDMVATEQAKQTWSAVRKSYLEGKQRVWKSTRKNIENRPMPVNEWTGAHRNEKSQFRSIINRRQPNFNFIPTCRTPTSDEKSTYGSARRRKAFNTQLCAQLYVRFTSGKEGIGYQQRP
jgi:hypothetical protein